jgi:hypothetical protein
MGRCIFYAEQCSGFLMTGQTVGKTISARNQAINSRSGLLNVRQEAQLRDSCFGKFARIFVSVLCEATSRLRN